MRSEHEHSPSQLQVITLENRGFQTLVAPEYTVHHCGNACADFTSDLLLGLSRDNRLFIDIGAYYGYYTILVGMEHLCEEG
jgi:hypothetical protein